MLIGFTVLLLSAYLALDRFVMPAYTRFGVNIVVPDTRGLSVEEADSVLTAVGLEIRHVVAPYVSSLPRDAVVDQDPPSLARVKPGRRVYLRINSGQVPMVAVLRDTSIRRI